MIAGYTYNGNGQRVKKVVNGTATIFHYNPAYISSTNQIMLELSLRKCMPVWTASGEHRVANTYYYHNDNLAVPQ